MDKFLDETNGLITEELLTKFTEKLFTKTAALLKAKILKPKSIDT